MRVLIDLMRENEARVQEMATGCAQLLELASMHLKVLDPEAADEELIEAVAEEYAKLCR